jgi:two-component SAPR family response regulator
MTDRNKFEQMLEHLINEDSDKAKELFHQLVVEKSREIYENILAEDFTTEEAEEDEE